jgi:U3 small nucleolar RNA-associated protein 5
MGNTKKSRSSASHISSATAPASSSTTQTGSKSSILRSLFCPSQLQLSLFASVIQGLDSQHLRIHDTATGRLRFPEYATAPKATINCLDWGYYGENKRDRHHQESKKKRKRSEQANGTKSEEPAGDVVVAFGTSESKVHMYSVTEGKILGVLEGEHTQGIRDFKFTSAGTSGEGWSVGGDGKVIRWDLRKGKVLR